MKFLLSFVAFTIFHSCNLEDRCDENFKLECVGIFGIDTLRLPISDKNMVQENKWDTIKLISEPDGTYYFDTMDTIFKKLEGKWSIRPYKIDGQCMINIKQNDGVKNEGEPFVITISPNNFKSMLIYFTRRINETGGHN